MNFPIPDAWLSASTLVLTMLVTRLVLKSIELTRGAAARRRPTDEEN